MTGNDNGQPVERLAYSVNEAAAITGPSRDLLYDQMRTGKLAYRKVGVGASSPASIWRLLLAMKLPYRLVLTIANGVDHEVSALLVNGHQDLAVDTSRPGIPSGLLTA